MLWIFIVLYAIAFAIVTSLAAKSRGRDAESWFLIGLLFGIFGLIAVLVMEPAQAEDVAIATCTRSREEQRPKTKKCPDCAEEIKFEAKVCRFCGKRFEELGIEAPASQVSQKPKIQFEPRKEVTRTVRCPHCYSMNYTSNIVCSSCGRDL